MTEHTFEITGEAEQKLDWLAESLDCEPAEVLHRALAMLEAAEEARQDGLSVGISKPYKLFTEMRWWDDEQG
ncbi:MAG: hypothetical protein ABEN55_03975 [Bradymonadaceae bacterium]